MKTYFEKLQDPRWQKRRLEIMQRDDFACQRCESKGAMLTVHHRWYEKGKDPWDYPDRVLITLCNSCHKETEEQLASIRMLAGNFDKFSLDMVIGFCLAMATRIYDKGNAKIPDGNIEAIASGIACFVKLGRQEVLDHLRSTGNVLTSSLVDEMAFKSLAKAESLIGVEDDTEHPPVNLPPGRTGVEANGARHSG